MTQAWLPILIMLTALIVQVGAARPVDQDLKALQYWQQLAMDDPAQALEEATRNLRDSSSNVSAEEQLETYYFLRTAGASLDSSLETKAAELNRTLEHRPLALLGKMQNAIEQHKKSDESEKRALIQELLGLAAMAVQQDWPYVEALILLKVTDLEYELGDVPSGLLHVQRIMKSLQGRVPDDSYPLIRARHKLSDFMDPQGESEKAEKVMEEAIQILKAKPYRFELSNAHRLLGMTIARQGKDYPRAEREYQTSLHYAREIGARKMEGRTLVALGGIYGLTGRFVESQPIFDQAIALMKETGADVISICDAYRLKARNFIRARQWSDALEAIRSASLDEAVVDKNYRILLLDMKAQALAGMGRFQEAYEERQNYIKVFQEIQEADRASDINRLKVDMGLRIEEEQNKKLQLENRVHRQIALGVLTAALLIMTLLLIALKNARAVRSSQQRMKRILDHMEEGILTIGSGLAVEADLSPYLMKILGETEPLQSVTKLLEHFDISQDTAQTIQAALQAVMGEAELGWTLNAAQLPSTVRLLKQEKHLALEWQAVYERDIIHSVLLVMRDITDRLNLLEERDQARSEAQKVDVRSQEVLRLNPRTAEVFLRDLESMLPEIVEGLKHQTDMIHTQRLIHTIKGVARSLGLKDLSMAAHQLEDAIEAKKKGLELGGEERLEFFVSTASAYMKFVRHFFDRNRDRSDHVSLLEIVSRHLGSVQKTLETASFQLATVSVQDDFCRWDEELDHLINSLLIHALANCVDHGFILPKSKGLDIAPDVRIQFRAHEADAILHLELRDNGHGIDMDRVKKLAQKAGFRPGPDQHWTDFLFEDGISTAAEVSERSGRGVGLAAMRELCRQHKGRIELLPNETGHGTLLRVQIPWNHNRQTEKRKPLAG
jgi:HPt (histidine-containing phosphotransfer) domain-containing protein